MGLPLPVVNRENLGVTGVGRLLTRSCPRSLWKSNQLRLSLTNLGCQLAGTALQGTTLLCLRETNDIQSTITQVIALGK